MRFLSVNVGFSNKDLFDSLNERKGKLSTQLVTVRIKSGGVVYFKDTDIFLTCLTCTSYSETPSIVFSSFLEAS